MIQETNRIEYNKQLTDDLEKGAAAFLNFLDGRKMGWVYCNSVQR